MSEQRNYQAPGSLIRDFTGLGPASTPGRELVVTVVLAAALAAVLVRTGLSPIKLVVAGAFGLYLVGRWLVGSRQWRARGQR